MYCCGNKKEFFDYHAKDWDFQYDLEEIGRIKNLLSIANLSYEEFVLDVGCGAGGISGILAQFVTKGSVKSIDISGKMLEEARKKNFAGNISFIKASADNLPFENDSFTAVIAFNSFPHFDDKVKTISEFARVLRVGGRVFILHSASRDRINQIHAEASCHSIKHDAALPPEILDKMLSAGGFEKIRVDDSNEYFYLEYRLKS